MHRSAAAFRTLRVLRPSSRLPVSRHVYAQFEALSPQFLQLARTYASKSFPSHQIVDMPALSPTMTQGNIGTWQKNAGDAIAPGDVLVEIETDKAQMDFEFQEEGFIAKLLQDSGAKDVKVGSPIAVLVENEEDVAAFVDFSVEDAGGAAKADAQVEAPEKPQEKQAESTDSTPPTAAKQETDKSEDASKESASSSNQTDSSSSSSGRIMATPIARRMAEEKGIALRDVKGSGPEGRIIKTDIENFKPAKSQQASATSASSTKADAKKPAAVTSAASGEAAAYTDIPLTGMRKTIAARLSESMQTAPHYYLTVAIHMDKVSKLREALNAKSEGRYKLSVNDFIVKGVAQALKEVPEANSAWYGDFIRQNHNADISVAVATPAGLMTPIIKSAQAKGLSEISNNTKELAKRARDGKLQPQEYQGGTFTISNLGMFGIDQFTAIINPPQACILAVGQTADVLELDPTSERGFKSAKVMKCTLSSDHRVVDGAVGAKFTAALKRILENPLELLL